MPELAPAPASLTTTGETALPRVPNQLYALKDGDSFVVADAFGDILGNGDGLFRNDTRVLSRFCLELGGTRPSLLSAAVSRDNVFFTSHTTNRPLPPLGGRSIPEGVIHLQRARLLWQEHLYERITCTNYSDREAIAPLSLTFAADFYDMFEVRGEVRANRGRLLPISLTETSATLRYEGLDGLMRVASIAFSMPPSRFAHDRAEFLLAIPADSAVEVYVEIGADLQLAPGRRRFRAAAAQARRAMRTRLQRGARIRSSGHLFNEWMDKSRADLALLTTELSTGPYPYAGIPWFSTPFGRDAIVTALQTLWLDPQLARGVLRFLAHNQAQETSPFQDSAPGKIMHETRKGEMTALRELPFGKYYGGVDTTPLFVMLAGAYANRTADLSLIAELWPALVAAMTWIESVTESNPEGFLVYARGADSGLANQGWKDSDDSIFHADGSNPSGPIALVEVQGYVFAALRAMADLAERRGDPVSAVQWRTQAESLRSAVEGRFWMQDARFYGLAVDGTGAMCRVSASNAGHLLYVGLPPADRGAHVSRQLLSRSFNTGWGVRTLAKDQPRFNPMSYHNGSVWPHDTAICAAGVARYSSRRAAVHLIDDMFESAVNFDMRLPELFCGFPRFAGEPPIAYPVACLPQAWAAGAVFMMLQACLGVTVDGWRREIHIDHPELPSAIDRLRIRDLAVGKNKIDLVFQRNGSRVIAFPEGDAAHQIPVSVHI